MSLIRADYHYLWPGLILLACTAACSDLATVPYNAMLRQLSTSETFGPDLWIWLGRRLFRHRVLLLVVYSASSPGTATPAVCWASRQPTGEPVRAAVLLTAAWFAVFALPLLRHRRARSRRPTRGPGVGFLGAYRGLWAEVIGEWRRDRNVVYYLLASAVFRDGLTGVFTFGAVLGVTVYGVSQADVLLFGICACVVAAVGAVLGGLLDDRVGSKPVIVGSLTAMIVVGAGAAELCLAP